MKFFLINYKNAIVFAGIIIAAIAVVAAVKLSIHTDLPVLPRDAIEIVLSKSQYAVGEEIYFGILNNTDRILQIENECPREPLEIYKLSGSYWQHIRGEAEVKCSQKHIALDPGELKGASFLPWQKILFNSVGTYKIVVEVEGYKGEFEKIFTIIQQ
ncbi:hypothetical protein EPN15_05080 [Patescibacteria group bacterium]|nr:MAG: hypothetical protein EPN15_05080 [Patescibacteria group bacterium]